MAITDKSQLNLNENWIAQGRFCPYEDSICTIGKTDSKQSCNMFGINCPAGENQMRQCNAWLEQGEHFTDCC